MFESFVPHLFEKMVRQGILLYLLPGGCRVNRLRLRWMASFCILWALCRNLTLPMLLML